MAKNKGTRIIITLRCTHCEKESLGHQTMKRTSNKISYTTTKNRRNTPDRLEIKKFCPNCNAHTLHREIK